MTIGPEPLCNFCKHRIKDQTVMRCKAYPEGIPEDVYYNDHVLPVDGDNGITFEAEDGAEELRPHLQARLKDSLEWYKSQRLQEEEEKELIEKSEQSLEDWANEMMSKPVIKSNLHLFVQALMSVRHWIFDTLTQAQSENLYTALVERMISDKWSLKDLRETIQEAEPTLDDAQAETIARSESTLIVNKSREMQFEQSPPGKYGYYWSGPNDHRTTEICAAIKKRTPKDGFDTPAELSRVVTEEAQKYYADKGYKTQVREWLPHPNCRHTIISRMR